MTWLRNVAGAALAVLAVSSTASAQVARGSILTFAGTADAQDLGVPGVALDFVPQVTAAASGNTGSFASLNQRSGVGVTGTIADLLVGRGPQPISNLLVIGGYRFSLTSLPSGPFGQSECYVAPAPGQLCTPYQSALGNPQPTDALSPFYLANLPSRDPAAPITAAVAFNLVGTVSGARGPASAFFGTIYTTFPGLSYQEVLGGLEYYGAGGEALPGVQFTGTFVVGGRPGANGMVGVNDLDASVVPEPGTVALVAAGLAGVGLAGARRRRQA